mgnify:CR=1 FL=1
MRTYRIFHLKILNGIPSLLCYQTLKRWLMQIVWTMKLLCMTDRWAKRLNCSLRKLKKEISVDKTTAFEYADTIKVFIKFLIGY